MFSVSMCVWVCVWLWILFPSLGVNGSHALQLQPITSQVIHEALSVLGLTLTAPEASPAGRDLGCFTVLTAKPCISEAEGPTGCSALVAALTLQRSIRAEHG